MPETLQAPHGPEQAFPPPDTEQPPRAEQAAPGHAEVPKFAGSLLTEHVTSVDWEALEAMVSPRTGVVMGAAAVHNATFMPVFSDRLAAHLEPEAGVQPLAVTAEQVKEARPVIARLSRMIGVVSPSLAGWFDGSIARAADRKVDAAARRTARFVDAIGSAESPREAFVAEVGKVYELLRNNKFDDRPEAVLSGLLWDAADSQKNLPKHMYGRWLEENCPLIANSLPIFMNEALGDKLRQTYRIRAVAPEIIDGLAKFLEQQTGNPVEPIEINMDHSFLRYLGRRYKAAKIASIPDKLVQSLDKAQGLLPERGAQFKREIIHVARRAAAVSNPRRLVQTLLSPALYARLQMHSAMRRLHSETDDDTDDD